MEARVPRKVHLLALDELKAYLTSVFINKSHTLDSCDLKILQFTGGESNPTYLISFENSNNNTESIPPIVLRKKPPGNILSKAHDICREWLIMKSLTGLFPVPKMINLCNDSNIVGTPFFLMDFVPGQVFRDPSLPDLSPSDRRSVFLSVIDSMSSLHLIDIHSPPFKPLLPSSFLSSKRRDYYTHQATTWTRQYRSSETDQIPEMESLIDFFSSFSNHPKSSSSSLSSIVHGDFRLENIIWKPPVNQGGDLFIAAIIDWELWSFGHPFSDLATFCSVYCLPPPFGLGDNLPQGIPKLTDLLFRYQSKTGFVVEGFDFYLAFALFRLACIIQGVFKRSLQGNASSVKAHSYQPMVTGLAQLASEKLKAFQSSQIESRSSLSIDNQSIHLSPILSDTNSQKILSNQLASFIDEFLVPNEHRVLGPNQHRTGDGSSSLLPLLEDLKVEAKRRGLWNLFLPQSLHGKGMCYCSPHCGKNVGVCRCQGCGLSNLEYAPMCEMIGKHPGFEEVFNCNAPDTGNMEILLVHGSESQKNRWLAPLLTGEIRSCFAMTEPDVASSDATNIRCSIQPQGSNYLVNGTKWWISGAGDPRCKLCIIMGKTDPTAPVHQQQSMILCPMDSPGVKVIRQLDTFGFLHGPGGHSMIEFTNVILPKENILGGEGKGFLIAQSRLGPGRVHHCMRLIGLAERALEVAVARSIQRKAFGKELARQGTVQEDIAKSRCEIEQARLLTLQTAHLMDVLGNKKARKEIAMIKVVVPRMAQRVIDRAIQIHGAAGLCSDFGLAQSWTIARALRIADGPDAVHLRTVALLELKERGAKL